MVDVRDRNNPPGLEIVQRVYGDMTIDGDIDVTALDNRCASAFATDMWCRRNEKWRSGQSSE